MDFLARLRTFVAIADAGSISRAAKIVRLSVAMTSRHLKHLEAELEVALVRRTTRQLQLTAAGLELLDRARHLLAEVEDVKHAIRPGKEIRATLVISVPVSLGTAQISPLLPPLLLAHPQLQLELRFEDRAVDLLGENVDIAVRAGIAPPDSPSLVGRPLLSYERVLCASPAFARKHKLRDARALERVSCLVQGSGPARWRLVTGAGPVEVRVDGALRTSNVFALRDAAVAGLGVAQLPIHMIADALRARQLVRVIEGATPPPGTVFAVYHQASRRSAAIRVVLDHLATALARTT